MQAVVVVVLVLLVLVLHREAPEVLVQLVL
jgi:hypothetical protein